MSVATVEACQAVPWRLIWPLKRWMFPRLSVLRMCPFITVAAVVVSMVASCGCIETRVAAVDTVDRSRSASAAAASSCSAGTARVTPTTASGTGMPAPSRCSSRSRAARMAQPGTCVASSASSGIDPEPG